MHCIIAEKTIALGIKCGSARVRRYVGEVTQDNRTHFSLLLSSIHVNGHIFESVTLQTKCVKRTLNMSQMLIVNKKKIAFFV